MLKVFQIFLLISGIILLSSKVGYSGNTPSQRIISNTATASYLTSRGDVVIIESSPEGNSIPGTGKGTPVITIILEPEEPSSDDIEEKK